MRRQPVTEPAVIIGGGPAGCAAAIRLGLAGHRPLVLERSTGPTDKVCGDFLGVDTIDRLRVLGVDPAGLGAAPIDRLRLIHRDRVAETALPFPAFGLSRRALDDALLRRAAETGATICLGQSVRRFRRQDESWQIDIGQSPPVRAVSVFLATGKHDMRDWPRPGVATGAVGMKMYYELPRRQTAKLDGAIELILFPGGYAGLQCVEAGRAVLCIAINRARFLALGGSWSALLDFIEASSPLLHDRLAVATPLLPRPLAVAGVPYGWLHQAPEAEAAEDRALYRLGDQAAVIPSLTGDGIAIAVHTGALAADAWLSGAAAVQYHRHLGEELGRQMRLARLLHKAALTGPLQGAAVRLGTLLPLLLQHAARGTRVGGYRATSTRSGPDWLRTDWPGAAAGTSASAPSGWSA